MRFDISLPKDLPLPSAELVNKGRKFSDISDVELETFCQTSENIMLDTPVSTYVSVTAKGVRVNNILGSAENDDKNAGEPVCPDSPSTNMLFLEQMDSLPAYRFRSQLKFYHPEKALRDTLLSLYGNGAETMDQVASKLFQSMKSARKVDWALATLSALYWRVKGDAENAVRCLRYSLNISPGPYRDVPLISLANIYHQAGFLNSALVVGGKALEISPDSVVAIHFTIANIYASMGKYSHAMDFYHSTLALQSNFQAAKERVWTIHCNANSEEIDG